MMRKARFVCIRTNAKKTIVIGDEELEKGVVQIKDMDRHEQQEVSFDNILEMLKKA